MAVSSVYRSGSPRLPAFTAARCAVTWGPRGNQEVMKDEGQPEQSKWIYAAKHRPHLLPGHQPLPPDELKLGPDTVAHLEAGVSTMPPWNVLPACCQDMT